MKNKKIIYGGAAVVVIAAIAYFLLRPKKKKEEEPLKVLAIPKKVYTDKYAKKAFVNLYKEPSTKSLVVDAGNELGLDDLVFDVLESKVNTEGTWYKVVSDMGDKGWLKSDEVLEKK